MKNVVLILLIAFYNVGVQAKSGEEIYKDRKINCAQCHGKDGMGMAKKKGDGSWGLSLMKGPRIAGLSKEDIKKALMQIQDKDKSKKRKTRYTSMMKKRISKLSAEDFDALAEYVSTAINPSAGSYKSEIWPRD